MTFQISEKRVPVDMLYTSNEKTPELSRLRRIMRRNMRGCANKEFMSDTVRIFQKEV
jgi:hypothetical protein